MSKKKIAIASDHAGFYMKDYLKKEFTVVDWVDEGPSSIDRVDYPDFAKKVGLKVSKKEVDCGILVCGSGIGMSISANKIKGVRAAVVESEIAARLAKHHNDANILCLGSRIIAYDYAKEIVRTWLESTFDGGRHSDRIQKIAQLESLRDDEKSNDPVKPAETK